MSTVDGKVKLISRKEWLFLSGDVIRRNEECYDRYLDVLESDRSSEELREYAAERVETYENVIESNELLNHREKIERGYNLYGLNTEGMPLLIPVSGVDYKEKYDMHGNLKKPWYVS